MKACGLSLSYLLPSRRIFDRTLKTVSTDIKERIATTGNLFVSDDLVKPHVVAMDTTLLRSKGKVVLHVSSMKEGIVPCPGIDSDARWGLSHVRWWIFGYKLHLVCNTDPSTVIVPLSVDVTTANNMSDKPVYPDVISHPSSETLKKIYYVVADPGYDDQELYDLSVAKGFQIVCPVRRYKNTPEERLKLVDFL
jgi:hypothetical protein